jgi:hypothetical protein
MSIITDFLQNNPITGPIAGLLNVADKVIDRTLPDPEKVLEAKILDQNGELAVMQNEKELALSQVENNKVEATSSDKYVTRWRPSIGWICVFSLACYYPPKFLMALIMWVFICYTKMEILPYPDVGIVDIVGLTGSLLGISTLRTYEKKQGIA